ncbi:hypothetical protein [Collibacillus ludicampi]|nr:hypothetical protein [Collibacillus ludicampi]
MSWISLIFVAIVSIYVFRLTTKRKTEMSIMTGMIVAMSNAMMSSVVVGTIIAMMIMKMFVPTVVGVLMGMIVGYLTGKPLGFMAIIDGIMAGIMGGMMGAMLGVMTMDDHPLYMVLFVDLVYILMMAFLWGFLSKESANKSNDQDSIHHNMVS